MMRSLRRMAWLVRNWIRGDYEGARISYGQFAEDILIFEALRAKFPEIDAKQVRYLDIGANHPSRLSNTMFFYHRGGKGVLVEPNPVMASLLKRRRPKDLVLSMGVAANSADTLRFFLMAPDVLSTFCEQTAQQYESLGYKHQETIAVPVRGIGELLSEHFGNTSPHILSVDVEGLDEQILTAIDWHSFQPLVVCAETWDMGTRKEQTTLVELLQSHGYDIFAKIGPNTIFVHR